MPVDSCGEPSAQARPPPCRTGPASPEIPWKNRQTTPCLAAWSGLQGWTPVPRCRQHATRVCSCRPTNEPPWLRRVASLCPQPRVAYPPPQHHLSCNAMSLAMHRCDVTTATLQPPGCRAAGQHRNPAGPAVQGCTPQRHCVAALPGCCTCRGFQRHWQRLLQRWHR